MFAFIKCGLIGWGMESLWTGLGSLIHGDGKLMGQSSLWMFPIYGMAALILPAYQFLKPLNIVLRGLIYMVCIFTAEYLTGFFLRSLNLCPWDYSLEPWNINGLIRLDYAPLWFLAGLFFEWMLCRSSALL